MCHSAYEKKKIPTQTECQGRNSEQLSCKHAAQAESQVRGRRVPGHTASSRTHGTSPREQTSKHKDSRSSSNFSRCKSVTEPLTVRLTYKNTIYA